MTVIAIVTEKHGGRLGGFLVGFPSTVAFSLFFSGLFVSVPVADDATNALPVFLSVIGIFLLSFGFLAAKGFAAGLFYSLVIWSAVSLVVLLSGIGDFLVALFSSAAISVPLYLAFRFRLKPRKPTGSSGPRYTVSLLLVRFTLGGGTVALAVMMSHLGAPILSAMFSSFPALSISTLVAIRTGNKAEGTENAKGMTMAMFVSVMLMLIPFSVVVHYLYPLYGIWWGTLAAYASAAAVGLPYYLFFEKTLVPSFPTGT